MEEKIKTWLSDYTNLKDGDYEIVDGIINAFKDVEVKLHNSTINFPSFIQFGYVDGNFDCSENDLTSLEGCPIKVKGIFNCDHNNLTSLVGSPKEVDGDYYSCAYNSLETLKGSPEKIKGDFYCHHNDLFTLAHAPKEVDGNFYCQHNAIVFSYDEDARNIKLKGSFVR